MKTVKWLELPNAPGHYAAQLGGLDLAAHPGGSFWWGKVTTARCVLGRVAHRGPRRVSPEAAKRDAEEIAFSILHGMRAVATKLLAEYGQLDVEAAED